MKRALLALAVAALPLACTGETAGRASAPTTQVAIGAPAPLYTATTLEGDSTSLVALKGRVVLFNIWATWCHPCRAEIPELQALHAQFADQGLSLVGVSVDGDDADAGIRDFMREFKMTYTVWRDPEERALTMFRTIGVPATFLIDRAGVLRWRMTGPIRPNDTTLVKAIEAALASPARAD